MLAVPAAAAMAAILAVTATAAVPSAASGDAGRQAFERGCSGCHALDVAIAQGHGGDEWAAIVDMMVARGAPLSDADQTAIIRYLAKRYPAGQ